MQRNISHEMPISKLFYFVMTFKARFKEFTVSFHVKLFKSDADSETIVF